MAVHNSTIDKAGNGLFTTRPFRQGELVTEYSGQNLTHPDQNMQPWQSPDRPDSSNDRLRNGGGIFGTSSSTRCGPEKVKASRLRVQTHIAANGRVVIAGDQRPILGSGGGSFANHAATGWNAKLVSVGTDLYLEATKDIPADEEVFLHYSSVAGLGVAMGEKQYKECVDKTNFETDRPYVELVTAPLPGLFGSDGYQVFTPDGLLDRLPVAAIRESDFTDEVFQSVEGGECDPGDCTRSQTTAKDSKGWVAQVADTMTQELQEIGVLQGWETPPKIPRPNAIVALKSTALESSTVRPAPADATPNADAEGGAAECSGVQARPGGVQAAHADAAPPGSLRHLAVQDVPLSVLVALQDDTKLWIKPLGAGTGERQEPKKHDTDGWILITLEAGQMLIFRQLIHTHTIAL